MSRSGQLQEQGFSVEVLILKVHQQGPHINKSGPYMKNDAENLMDFYTPSVKQISDFFMYLDLSRCPSTMDDFRTTIFDPLDPGIDEKF